MKHQIILFFLISTLTLVTCDSYTPYIGRKVVACIMCNSTEYCSQCGSRSYENACFDRSFSSRAPSCCGCIYNQCGGCRDGNDCSRTVLSSCDNYDRPSGSSSLFTWISVAFFVIFLIFIIIAIVRARNRMNQNNDDTTVVTSEFPNPSMTNQQPQTYILTNTGQMIPNNMNSGYFVVPTNSTTGTMPTYVLTNPTPQFSYVLPNNTNPGIYVSGNGEVQGMQPVMQPVNNSNTYYNM